MKLFELLGVITVNNQDANNKISETTEKTEGLHSTLVNGMETAGKWALKFAAAAATAAAATTAALVKIVSNNTAAMDTIDKASQRLGMTKKSYQEWSYVMGQCGLNMEQMESGMMALTNKMKEAADPNSDASKAFKMLGVAVTDSEGNLRSVNDVFEETVAAMTMIENEGEKLALADMLFAGSGQLMMPLLNTAYDRIVELKQTANDLGLVLTDEQIAAAVQFVDTADTLKQAYGTLGTEIANTLVPALEKFYQFLIDYYPTIKKEFVEGFLPALKDVVSGVFELIQALLDPDGEMQLEESINKIVKGIVSIVGKLAEHAPTLVDGLCKLFEALLPHVGTLIDALVPLVTAILVGLMEKIPELAGAVGGALSDNSDSFLTLLLGILGFKGVKKLGSSSLDWLRKAIYPDTPTTPPATTPTTSGGSPAPTGGGQPTTPTTPTAPAVPPSGGMKITGADIASGIATVGMVLFPILAAPGLIDAVTNPDKYDGSEEIFNGPAFDGVTPTNYSPAQMMDIMRNYNNGQAAEEDDDPQYMTDDPSVGTGDPLGVEYYRKEYGDDWFDKWYDMNKDILEPGDLDYVIDKYDVPTFGNAIPGFGNGLFGALSAFMPGGNGFIGGDITPLTLALAELNTKLETVINQQAQGKTIVLNTGALVGGIGNAMDKYLGNTVNNKARGMA